MGLKDVRKKSVKVEALFDSILSANKALESASQTGSEGLRGVMLKSFTLNL